MILKKLFAALLVPALSATVFAGIASADYSYDAATGTRTWTFKTPAETYYLNDTANTTTYYLYSDTLSDCYGTDDDALAKAKDAQTDKDLLITSTVDDDVYVNSIAGRALFGAEKVLKVSYTVPCDGRLKVEGSNTYINNIPQESTLVSSGDVINISSLLYQWYVTKITFTPKTSTKTFTVNPITIGNDTKDAGVTFKADGYSDWNCSIWDKVSDFRGNVNFNVQMTNVPANVEVSAQSYIK